MAVEREARFAGVSSGCGSAASAPRRECAGFCIASFDRLCVSVIVVTSAFPAACLFYFAAAFLRFAASRKKNARKLLLIHKSKIINNNIAVSITNTTKAIVSVNSLVPISGVKLEKTYDLTRYTSAKTAMLAVPRSLFRRARVRR